MTDLPVTRLHEEATLPTRAYEGDAGLDLSASERVELGPPLAKIGRRRVFWKHDQHLNSYGHAVVADLLYPALVRDAKE